MNIFYTHPDPIQSANEHCDIHVRKMIVESAQLLCTAHHVIAGGPPFECDVFYKPTHRKHPSALWVRCSANHYIWLYEMFGRLCELYTLKTGKVHSTWTKLRAPLKILPVGIANLPFIPPFMAMPDEFKMDDDYVHIAYQNYLNAKFKGWMTRDDKRRMTPTWTIATPSWVKND